MVYDVMFDGLGGGYFGVDDSRAFRSDVGHESVDAVAPTDGHLVVDGMGDLLDWMRRLEGRLGEHDGGLRAVDCRCNWK